MARKDGRPLVTEHPVTGMDWIDYVTDDELEDLPGNMIMCSMGEPVGSLGDDDPSPDDFDDWGA